MGCSRFLLKKCEGASLFASWWTEAAVAADDSDSNGSSGQRSVAADAHF